MNVQRRISADSETNVLRGRIVSGGRLQIPAEIRRELGLKDGDGVRMTLVDGELRVKSYLSVIAHVQELLKPYAPIGYNVSDELIAERRAEAAKE